MSQEHSPEPWTYEVHGHAEADLAGADGRGLIGCNIMDHTGFLDEPDARRIVACVNACRGIPTEAIEKGQLLAYLIPRDAAIESRRTSQAETAAQGQ